MKYIWTLIHPGWLYYQRGSQTITSSYLKLSRYLMLYNWRRKWQPTPVFLPEKSHGRAWQATVPGVATVRHNLATKWQHVLANVIYAWKIGIQNDAQLHQYSCVLSLCFVQFFETLWTVAHQAPLSMGFSRQEYWSRLPFSSPGDLSDPGIKPTSLSSLALAGRSFTTKLPRKLTLINRKVQINTINNTDENFWQY